MGHHPSDQMDCWAPISVSHVDICFGSSGTLDFSGQDVHASGLLCVSSEPVLRMTGCNTRVLVIRSVPTSNLGHVVIILMPVCVASLQSSRQGEWDSFP